MDFSTVIFASLLVLAGLLLILRVRATLQGEPPPDTRRDRQWVAYEERRMRVRRDRVWWRVEALHSEFTEREAAGRPREAHGPAPRPVRGGNSDALTPGDVRAAYEQFLTPRHDRREDDPPHAI